LGDKKYAEHQFRRITMMKRKNDVRAAQEKRWKPEIVRKICKTCSAPCCKKSLVVLDREAAERRLHQYRYQQEQIGLLRRAPVLKRRKDGSCVYLDRETGGCGIYERRPAACRGWFCGKGTRHNAIWLHIKDKGG
jgi:hypothetical protein